MSRTLFRVSGMRASCKLAGLNRRSAQVPHTHQVVRGTGEGEHPVHLKDPAMARLLGQSSLLFRSKFDEVKSL